MKSQCCLMLSCIPFLFVVFSTSASWSTKLTSLQSWCPRGLAAPASTHLWRLALRMRRRIILFAAVFNFYNQKVFCSARIFDFRCDIKFSSILGMYAPYYATVSYLLIQGARGIGARFLKLSPASAISPILTKFWQHTSYSTCYSVVSTIVHLPARLKGPRQESQRGDIVKIIRAV